MTESRPDSGLRPAAKWLWNAPVPFLVSDRIGQLGSWLNFTDRHHEGCARPPTGGAFTPHTGRVSASLPFSHPKTPRGKERRSAPSIAVSRTRPQPSVLRDVSTPVLVLHEHALETNIEVMASFCEVNGLEIAPHAKTSMASYIIDRQMAAGAWGMSVASTQQAQQLHAHGVERIIVANQVVEDLDIAWLARQRAAADSRREVVCYVDSIAGIHRMEHQLARLGGATDRRLGVLVELGYHGGRTGARSVMAGLAVARRVAVSSHLALRGVAGFEGLMARRAREVPTEVETFLTSIRDLVQACHRDRLFTGRPIVSAGGSSFFDAAARHLGPPQFNFPVVTILRSGCYAIHDHGLYEDTSPFGTRASSGQPRLAPALELIATVLSRPEPGLAIVNFGRRHAPIDHTLPLVLGSLQPDGTSEPLIDATVRQVDDQHAHVAVAHASHLGPGDRIRVGVSHPCGAFDRWREVAVVDPTYQIVAVASPSFGDMPIVRQ